jgi:hypothetical protein
LRHGWGEGVAPARREGLTVALALISGLAAMAAVLLDA